ncbi:unnamed protein product, partial [Closterium sp. Naga37s-1]
QTGVAFLLALADANNLSLSPQEIIELDRLIENGFLGLRNGVLDQSAIVLSKSDHLTRIWCQDRRHGLRRLKTSSGPSAWLHSTPCRITISLRQTSSPPPSRLHLGVLRHAGSSHFLLGLQQPGAGVPGSCQDASRCSRTGSALFSCSFASASSRLRGPQ